MRFGTPQRHLLGGALLACAACLATAPTANAADGPSAPQKVGPLSGTPVNSAVSGGGILPKGVLLSALNMSFRDKDDIVEDAGAGARTSNQQIYLLKLRYGITDNLELAFVPGFVHNSRDAYGPFGSDTLEGPTDFGLAFTYAPLLQRQGAPISLGIALGANLPTGQSGADRPPGNDVWSYSAKVGVSKIWQSGHRLDGDIGLAQPTQTGNQGVRKDTTITMTGSYHYIFNPTFDVGLEFTLEKSEDWEREGVSMDNGYTEMYLGPTMNFNLNKLNMWLGVGVFFPVFRDYDIPTATDDIRFEVKLGKIWTW